jgi:hypothetical protein
MKPLNHVRIAALLLVAAGVLSACGGGGDDTPPPTTVTPPPVVTTPVSEVPASATSSVAGLFAYVSNLIASMTSDTASPVVLGNAVLPTSDTTEAN